MIETDRTPERREAGRRPAGGRQEAAMSADPTPPRGRKPRGASLPPSGRGGVCTPACSNVGTTSAGCVDICFVM
ncbi:hypothetical protein EYF80_041989 [Liparis tanakae]|uniref:Uncharacterized protein n=1 Tax=Liparis tanakae TaxID=230148 RepID=A0A4Z2G5C6_9TELE|nr:hypothetical protein EYF80_041989 [Liparis tanakae]